jgi:spore coat polysaccharide biosynthesis predicted glycosyltransferase SpsG/RimJ/RimL family protein N-acetyltransferase
VGTGAVTRGGGGGRPVLVAVPQVGGVGVGHFMRCVALAQAWNARSGRSIVVAPPLDPALAGLLTRDDVRHVAAAGSEAVTESIRGLAAEQPITAIAVDGYDFGARLERALHPFAAATIAFDDGNETGAHAVDLLTDPTPGVTAACYGKSATGARLLLGPRFAALRREFVPNDGEAPAASAGSHSITVLAGGEPRPEVQTWFGALADGLRGAGYAVRAPGISDPRTDDVVALMQDSLVAVSTGGSTSLELCRLGVPAVLVVVADNQVGLAAGLDEVGAARQLGRIGSLDPSAAVDAVCALASDEGARRALANRGRELVDGRGAGRLVVALRAAALRLEPAGPQHAELLWTWANDPDTRAASFSHGAIPWADHERWFAARLADPGCRIFIASPVGSAPAGSAPIGQIRFERAEAGIVVGVSLAAECRGRGFAAALIAAGAERARRDLSAEPIVAYVQRDNVRSRRAFLDAGFSLHPTATGPDDSDVLVSADGES